MYLADSGGVVVQIGQSKWILEDYYKEHDYKPSRRKCDPTLEKGPYGGCR